MTVSASPSTQRPSVGDQETETFDDVIAPDRLVSPEVIVRDFESDPDEGVQWSARYVSSELFVDSFEYRTSVIDKIGRAHPEFQALFTAQGFVAADFEVVFAIVGDWTNRTLTDLPFFSKINLRKYSRALRRFGYRVTYSPIPVVDP